MSGVRFSIQENKIKQIKVKFLAFEYILRNTGMNIANQISPHQH